MVLDPMFHQIVRTRLAVLLAADARALRKLSAAGYLHSGITTKRRPHRIYELSPSGRVAFEACCQAMSELLFDAVNEDK